MKFFTTHTQATTAENGSLRTSDREASALTDQTGCSAEQPPIFPKNRSSNPVRGVRPALSLHDLWRRAKTADAQFTERPATQDDIKVEGGRLLYRNDAFPLTAAHRDELYRRVHAPAEYLGKLSEDLQDRVLATHVGRGDFGRRLSVVARGEEFATIARGDLVRLKNAEVLTGVAEGLGAEYDDVIVDKLEGDGDRLVVDIVSPSTATAVRPGDVVQAGLHIEHHRFGTAATMVQQFVIRLVCLNGLTRRECRGKEVPRTRRLSIDDPESRSLQIEQVSELTRLNWQGLRESLDRLQETTDRTIDVRKLLRQWLDRARISPKTTMDLLIEAWHRAGGEDTIWGAVNAITWVATHSDLSARKRRILASMGGLLAFRHVHLCDRCLSVLTSVHEDVEKSTTTGRTDEV